MVEAVQFRINTPDVVSETIDGESVIINLSTGTYYSLNRAGADIWNLIEAKVSLAALIEQLTIRYSGNSSDIQASVEQLIQQLQQEKLIVPVSELIEANSSGDGLMETGSVLEKQPFEIPTLQKFSDMEDLLLLDPIHEVDETAGWPSQKTA